MRFKDVFSIIGPSMIGPSSSHTAGAVRLGRVARELLGATPKEADIAFYGSFAATYAGHGTDAAVVAGLLGFGPDDARIPDSLKAAAEADMKATFRTGAGAAVHPNTLSVELRAGERSCRMTGCSIGGGNIEVIEASGFDLRFTADYPTTIVFHGDRPGMLADITRLLSRANVNIGYMDVDRKGRLGEAATAIETDGGLSDDLLADIRRLPGVSGVSYIDLNGGAKT